MDALWEQHTAGRLRARRRHQQPLSLLLRAAALASASSTAAGPSTNPCSQLACHHNFDTDSVAHLRRRRPMLRDCAGSALPTTCPAQMPPSLQGRRWPRRPRGVAGSAQAASVLRSHGSCLCSSRARGGRWALTAPVLPVAVLPAPATVAAASALAARLAAATPSATGKREWRLRLGPISGSSSPTLTEFESKRRLGLTVELGARLQAAGPKTLATDLHGRWQLANTAG